MSQQNHHLSISNMSCSGCVANIKGALSELPGADVTAVDLTDRTIVVTGDVELDKIIKVITAAGYNAIEVNKTTE